MLYYVSKSTILIIFITIDLYFQIPCYRCCIHVNKVNKVMYNLFKEYTLFYMWTQFHSKPKIFSRGTKRSTPDRVEIGSKIFADNLDILHEKNRAYCAKEQAFLPLSDCLCV